jgi:Fe-S-cluster containining protein
MTDERTMTLDLCRGCPGVCCKGIEERVVRPKTKQAIADIRWQLHFTHIQFFIRNRYWYRLIASPCMYLDERHFCTMYDDRPDVCRSHTPPNCEQYHPIYDTLFVSPDDLDVWVKREERRKKRKAARAKKADA